MNVRRKLSRKKFLGLLGVSVAGAAAYAHYIEPGWLEVGRPVVKLGGRTFPKPVKVLQLSDLHASDVVSLDFLKKAIHTGLELEPDLILLTGDFITGQYDRFADYVKVLRPLTEDRPCFATLGNHDGGRWAARHGGYEDTTNVRDLLAQSGIRLLENRSVEVTAGESTVRLVGLGDLWAGEFFPETAFLGADANREMVTLVLSHNPDTKDRLRGYAWDVMFCGHTHGGQLQVPLVGAPFAPVRDKRYVKGLCAWEGRWIHITKGVGNLHGVRFNCRPEISLITLS